MSLTAIEACAFDCSVIEWVLACERRGRKKKKQWNKMKEEKFEWEGKLIHKADAGVSLFVQLFDFSSFSLMSFFFLLGCGISDTFYFTSAFVIYLFIFCSFCILIYEFLFKYLLQSINFWPLIIIKKNYIVLFVFILWFMANYIFYLCINKIKKNIITHKYFLFILFIRLYK